MNTAFVFFRLRDHICINEFRCVVMKFFECCLTALLLFLRTVLGSLILQVFGILHEQPGKDSVLGVKIFSQRKAPIEFINFNYSFPMLRMHVR